MFVAFEKQLISRGYIPFVRTNNIGNNIFSYYFKDDKTKQVNIKESSNVYTFSFPMNDIHYSTKFYDKISLFEYAKYVLNQKEFIQVSKA